jgi:hypothetical protein
MGELPSMDQILAESRRNERRGSLKLGLFLIGSGLAVMFGLHSLIHSDGIQFYAVPTGVFVYGVMLVTRAISR